MNMHNTDGNLAALERHQKEIDAQYELDSAVEKKAIELGDELISEGEVDYSADGDDQNLSFDEVIEELGNDIDTPLFKLYRAHMLNETDEVVAELKNLMTIVNDKVEELTIDAAKLYYGVS